LTHGTTLRFGSMSLENDYSTLGRKTKRTTTSLIEEGGFAHEPKMKIMTRDEFKEEYEIDVPELFED